jgi:hypothetical protein
MGCSVVRDQAKFIRGWDRCISILPLKKSLSHVQYTGLWFNIYEKKTICPMPNFNENNIGLTKFCQENVTEVP